jgi:mannose-6-phosphate isomerase-like protein (cupin superfamily)
LPPACSGKKTEPPQPAAAPAAPVPELEKPAPKDQQLFKKADLITWGRDKASGGEGRLTGIYPFTRHNADPSWVIREIGWMTLESGHSIGSHGHVDNDDAYVIVSGTAEFTDSSGNTIPLGDRDITVTHPNQKHGIKNTGDTTLYFLDIVSNKTNPDPAWADEPQVFKAADLISWDRTGLGGGKGTIGGKFSYNRNDKKTFPLYEIGWLTIPPGASIGLHEHTDNEDAYIIISGTGEFAGTDGTPLPVGEGDITIARPGQKHSLVNTGTTDLVFLDIVAK